MGETRTTIRVYGIRGYTDVEVLVDTGTTFSKIPSDVAERLGLEIEGKVEVELADGRLVERGISSAFVEIEGVKRRVPLTISDTGERPLLGYTTLEILGFRVNPMTGRLEKVRPIEFFGGLRGGRRAAGASEARDFIEDEIKAEGVKIFRADDRLRFDPQGRAERAIPLRPAIFIE